MLADSRCLRIKRSSPSSIKPNIKRSGLRTNFLHCFLLFHSAAVKGSLGQSLRKVAVLLIASLATGNGGHSDLHFYGIFTPTAPLLITRLHAPTAHWRHERPDLHRPRRGVLRRQRTLRSRLREAVRTIMENLIVGLIALALFAYLLVAMLRPEKF
jgi:K+-transporting ATPase KdpF subunit